jgi:hypothetical protein
LAGTAGVNVYINVGVDVKVGVGVSVTVADGFNVHVGRGVNVIVLVDVGDWLGTVVNVEMRDILVAVGITDISWT